MLKRNSIQWLFIDIYRLLGSRVYFISQQKFMKRNTNEKYSFNLSYYKGLQHPLGLSRNK